MDRAPESIWVVSEIKKLVICGNGRTLVNQVGGAAGSDCIRFDWMWCRADLHVAARHSLLSPPESTAHAPEQS